MADPVTCPGCGGPGKVERDWLGNESIVCDGYAPCEGVDWRRAALAVDREWEDSLRGELDGLRLDLIEANVDGRAADARRIDAAMADLETRIAGVVARREQAEDATRRAALSKLAAWRGDR